MALFRRLSGMPSPDQTLPGRSVRAYDLPTRHAVLGTSLEDVPDGFEVAVFGQGCFWGAEKAYWELGDGIHSTAAGYAGGSTPNPTYEEVCTGRTGHAEVVRVVFDPSIRSYDSLLKAFWEDHDPTQGYRQGNDVGTQYRSAIFWTSQAQREAAEGSLETYASALAAAGRPSDITTEIAPLADFWYAEPEHQQYLAKNPYGYCPIHATGVAYTC